MGSNFLWLLEAGAVFFCSAGSRVAPVAGVWGWGAPGPRTTHSRGEKDAVLEKTKRANRGSIPASVEIKVTLAVACRAYAAIRRVLSAVVQPQVSKPKTDQQHERKDYQKPPSSPLHSLLLGRLCH